MSESEPAYSDRWFSTFAESVPDALVDADRSALEALFPRPGFQRLLEIGCGLGRHASGLTRRGYHVTAIEQNEASVATARAQEPAADIRHMDMRDVDELDATFDGCYLLWHSFGYFGDAENEAVAGRIADRLVPGGRLVVDLYNPAWVAANHGVRHRGDDVLTTRVVDDRQVSTIDYADGSSERFEWRLYAPTEFERLLAPHGFSLTHTGVWWDFSRTPNADDARFQLVLDRA